MRPGPVPTGAPEIAPVKSPSRLPDVLPKPLNIIQLVDYKQLMSGGESGIRTHVRVSPKHAFQACAFSHSAISPQGISVQLLEFTINGAPTTEAAGAHGTSPGRSPSGVHRALADDAAGVEDFWPRPQKTSFIRRALRLALAPRMYRKSGRNRCESGHLEHTER